MLQKSTDFTYDQLGRLTAILAPDPYIATAALSTQYLYGRNGLIERRINPDGTIYRHEYDKFQSSAKSKADRASRNKANRRAQASGIIRKGDGNDVDHKNGNPRDNRKSNTRVVSKSINRAKH